MGKEYKESISNYEKSKQNYFSRLTAKCANKYATAKLATTFAPIKLGESMPGGVEAVIHVPNTF